MAASETTQISVRVLMSSPGRAQSAPNTVSVATSMNFFITVAAQTAKPVRWVIVSHGSTDDTDGIVDRYVAQHPWIELVRMPTNGL